MNVQYSMLLFILTLLPKTEQRKKSPIQSIQLRSITKNTCFRESIIYANLTKFRRHLPLCKNLAGNSTKT